MIHVTDPVEALALLTIYAFTKTFPETTIDEQYIRNWARWTLLETKERFLAMFGENVPLFLDFYDDAIDIKKYDETYGEATAARVVESVFHG